ALEEATQQISTVARALRLASEVATIPEQTRVLDVGSGLDAVAHALEALSLLAPEHEVMGLEPSEAMRRMAGLIQSPVQIGHEAGSLEGLAAGMAPPGPYSSIFFIYSFQYSHADRPDDFFSALAR